MGKDKVVKEKKSLKTVSSAGVGQRRHEKSQKAKNYPALRPAGMQRLIYRAGFPFKHKDVFTVLPVIARQTLRTLWQDIVSVAETAGKTRVSRKHVRFVLRQRGILVFGEEPKKKKAPKTVDVEVSAT